LLAPPFIHREFRQSIAFDERLKKIANALGLKFKNYADAEQFFLDVARSAGRNGWELDRLLYHATDEVLLEIDDHAAFKNVSRQSRKFRFQTSTRGFYPLLFLCHSLTEHRLAPRPPVKAALRRASPARP
jgi:hypothetical protein